MNSKTSDSEGRELTPSLTTGPFMPLEFSSGCNDLTTLGGKTASGKQILLVGHIRNKSGAPLVNGIVEIWQADANGVFGHPADALSGHADPNFLGWGRTATDIDGRYVFRTIMPGDRPNRMENTGVPSIVIGLFGSGIMRRLTTRVYFGHSQEKELVLDKFPDRERGKRLFAKRAADLDEGDVEAYTFDIYLNGPRETPFFKD